MQARLRSTLHCPPPNARHPPNPNTTSPTSLPAPQAIEALIAAGADVGDTETALGATALHRAAALGHPAAVTALLAAGAKTSAGDFDGDTPLHWVRPASFPVPPGLLALISLPALGCWAASRAEPPPAAPIEGGACHRLLRLAAASARGVSALCLLPLSSLGRGLSGWGRHRVWQQKRQPPAPGFTRGTLLGRRSGCPPQQQEGLVQRRRAGGRLAHAEPRMLAPAIPASCAQVVESWKEKETKEERQALGAAARCASFSILAVRSQTLHSAVWRAGVAPLFHCSPAPQA